MIRILKMSASSNKEVIVFVRTADLKSEDFARIAGIFSNGIFRVVPVTVASAPGTSDIKQEHETIKKCLEVAEMKYPHNSMIYIKDNSATYMSPSAIAGLVNCQNQLYDWDLFYFANWLDKCNLYSDMKTLFGDVVTVKSQAPQGVQAIMMSPRGRRLILGKSQLADGQKITFDSSLSLSQGLTQAVTDGKLSAHCAVPSVMGVIVPGSGGVWQIPPQCADGSPLVSRVSPGAPASTGMPESVAVSVGGVSVTPASLSQNGSPISNILNGTSSAPGAGVAAAAALGAAVQKVEQKVSDAIWRKWWFWVIIILIIALLIYAVWKAGQKKKVVGASSSVTEQYY